MNFIKYDGVKMVKTNLIHYAKKSQCTAAYVKHITLLVERGVIKVNTP